MFNLGKTREGEEPSRMIIATIQACVFDNILWSFSASNTVCLQFKGNIYLLHIIFWDFQDTISEIFGVS